MPRRKLVAKAPQQASLFGITIAEKQEIATLEMEIKELHECLRWIEAVRNDDFIMFGVIASIERYGGRNLPYFLSWGFLSSVDKDEYSGPHPKNYDIGYYGGRPEQTEGSRKFVLDACAFGEKEWKEELECLEVKLQEIVSVSSPHFRL